MPANSPIGFLLEAQRSFEGLIQCSKLLGLIPNILNLKDAREYLVKAGEVAVRAKHLFLPLDMQQCSKGCLWCRWEREHKEVEECGLVLASMPFAEKLKGSADFNSAFVWEMIRFYSEKIRMLGLIYQQYLVSICPENGKGDTWLDRGSLGEPSDGVKTLWSHLRGFQFDPDPPQAFSLNWIINQLELYAYICYCLARVCELDLKYPAGQQYNSPCYLCNSLCPM